MSARFLKKALAIHARFSKNLKYRAKYEKILSQNLRDPVVSATDTVSPVLRVPILHWRHFFKDQLCGSSEIESTNSILENVRIMLVKHLSALLYLHLDGCEFHTDKMNENQTNHERREKKKITQRAFLSRTFFPC